MNQLPALSAAVFDAVSDQILILDAQGRIDYANQTARRMLEGAAGQATLVGRPLAELLPASQAGEPIASICGRALRGEAVTIDVLLPVDGQPRVLELVFSPYSGDGGRVESVVVIGRGVDRRAQAELERDHLFALVENSNDFIGMADATGRPFYVNPAGRRLVGLDEGGVAVEDTSIPDYYPPDQRELVEHELLPAMQEHGYWAGETYFRHFGTGARIPVSDTHFSVRHPDSGELVGFGTISRDISDAKRIEAALAISEARYRQLFNSIDEGFCVIEVLFDDSGVPFDYRFLEVNDAFERQTGLADATGKRMRELAPAHEEHWFEIYGRIAKTGEPARFRRPADAFGGRWYDVYAFRVDAPETGHVAILFKDVTDHVKAVELLRQTAATEALRADMADTLRTSSDPLEIEHQAVHLLGRYLGANRVHYASMSGDAEHVTVRTDYCDGVPSVVGSYRLDDYGPAIMDNVRAGRTVVVADVAHDAQLTPAEREVTAALAVGAYVVVPLIEAGRTVAIVVAHQSEPRQWSELEVGLLEETAERVWASVERAQADVALRESEERYRLISRATNDVIWDWNLETDQLVWNEAVIAHLGCSPEALGPTIAGWYGGIHPDDRERVVHGIHAAIQRGEETWSDEYRFRRSDGTYATFLDRGYIARRTSGRPYRMIGSMLDLSERRRMEEALRGAHRHTTTILESIADCFYTLDADKRFTYVNAQAEAYFGLPKDRMLGRVYNDVLPQTRGHEVLRYQQEAMETKRTVRFETLSPVTNKWVELSVYPTDDGGLSVYFRDVSERVHARRRQTALLELGDRLRLLSDPVEIAETAAEIVCRILGGIRAGYGALDASEAWYELGEGWTDGVTRGAAGKWRLADLWSGFTDALRRGETVVVADVAEDARLSAEAVQSHLAHGVRAFVSVPIVAEGLIAAVFYAQFGAARTLSEQELAFVRDVADRTWAAVERARAEVALREADRRKDEFLAMLAHELRNPLAAMYNTVSLLKKSAVDEQDRDRYVDILQRHTGSLRGLVDELLDVSRVTRGLVELRQERVDLVAAVGHALDSVRALVEEKRHSVDADLPAGPVPVVGDPVRLEQILVNLLTNAAKYTDPGGRISVSLACRDGGAEIRVRDTGVGFEPDVRERIFTLFGQADQTLDRSRGGLGIGLTVVKRLVELHGGRIDAHSAGPGRGAEFTVMLPLAAAGEAATPVPEQSAVAHRRRRILVVDDSPDIAETLALLLEDSGHEVAVANDGPSALQKAQQTSPDLVLLDIGLPGMDGYEVARRLRENPATRQVVLVALTGYGQASDRERTKAAGFDAHFVKPVDIDALETFVNEAAVGTGRTGVG